MTRRKFLKTAATGAAALGLPSFSHAQEDPAAYPTRGVRIQLGFSPGGPTDILLRALAEDARKALKQPVIVENRPGAGAVLPAVQMASTPADGYTLAVLVSGVFRTDLFKGDPTIDLAYIIGLAGYVFGTVVPADSPFRTMADLVAHARKNPGAVSYSTAGPNTIPHVVMEQLARSAGIQLNHIPYKGTAESMQAVMSGQVMASADASSWVPHVESGKLRLLAVWGQNRMARFPNVPTLLESGFNISDSSPWGLVAPKGTDPRIVQKVHDAFKQAMDMPAFKTGLARLDMEHAYMNPAAYRQWAVERQKLERARMLKT